MRNARLLEQNVPDAAAAIRALPWVEDGLDDSEKQAAPDLVDLGLESFRTFQSIMIRPWILDEIGRDELAVIDALKHISHYSEGDAERISEMPFLNTMEFSEAVAMLALRKLAEFDKGGLRRVLAAPVLRGGITDKWARIIPVLFDVNRVNTDMAVAFLDADRVIVEDRIIRLPLADDTLLTILRTAPGASRSIDLFEHSVRSAEDFMSVAFPASNVTMLFETTRTVESPTRGDGPMVLIPRFDVDDDSVDATFTGQLLAHEVSHYYWRGNQTWVNEGAAEFLKIMAGNLLTGRRVMPDRPPCVSFGNIADLERATVSYDPTGDFLCNYSLGQRLFLDMYGTLGELAFRTGFRNLYLMSDADYASRNRVRLGITHVERAFKKGATREGRAAVDEALDRWFYGSSPRAKITPHDPSPLESSLPTISGRIDDAFVTARQGERTSTLAADDKQEWAWLNLEYSNDNKGPFELKLDVVEYFEDALIRQRVLAISNLDHGVKRIWIGLAPSRKWSPGRYWVYAYHEGQKVAEVEYNITR